MEPGVPRASWVIVVQWSEEGLRGTFQKQGNEDRTVEESISGLLKKDSSLHEVKTPDQLRFRLRARERRNRQKASKQTNKPKQTNKTPHTKKTKAPNKKISFMKSVSLVIPVRGVFSNKMIKGHLVADFF